MIVSYLRCSLANDNDEHTLTVQANEFPPRHTPARPDRSNASLAQPRPHGGRGDAEAEAFQRTNDALVARSGVLAGEAEHQRANVPRIGRRPRRPLYLQRFAISR